MATNLLVTGSHGGDDPHVESKHDALMHAAMLGRGGYILKTRNWTMKPTAKDANNITIPAWDLVVEGRQIYIAAPTDVNIQSGSQGQKRRDLIVARYALNSGTGVETVTLEVIKGKPSAATPADPGIETGSIIGGAIVSDLPLCRVNLDGITITSIDTLVNVMQPLEDVWDSLTQSGPTTLLNGGPGGDKKNHRRTLGRDAYAHRQPRVEGHCIMGQGDADHAARRMATEDRRHHRHVGTRRPESDERRPLHGRESQLRESGRCSEQPWRRSFLLLHGRGSGGLRDFSTRAT